MKKHLLIWSMFIPMLLVAQIDSRYQAGVIPMEDGKVVFTHEINAPGLTQKQVFEKIYAWAELNYNTEKDRIIYTADEKGSFALSGLDTLTFSRTALGLDQAQMTYRVILQSKENALEVKLSNIRYIYNVTYQKEPERFVAEEIITDKAAINKNKLNRLNGKYRIATIDFKDQLFKDMEIALTGNVQPATASSKTIQPEPVSQNIPVSSTAHTPPALTPVDKEGYMAFEPGKVPQALLQLLPESKMQVSIDEQTPAETAATWKGISSMFGKAVATISIPSGSNVYKQMTGYYLLSFRKESTDTAPWMIIECKKQGETEETSHTTVIGEILHIWIK